MDGTAKQIAWATQILPRLELVVAQFNAVINYILEDRPQLAEALPALCSGRDYFVKFEWETDAELIIDLRDCDSPAQITAELITLGLIDHPKNNGTPEGWRVHLVLESLGSTFSVYRNDKNKLKTIDLHSFLVLSAGSVQSAQGARAGNYLLPQAILDYAGKNPENVIPDQQKLAHLGDAAFPDELETLLATGAENEKNV